MAQTLVLFTLTHKDTTYSFKHVDLFNLSVTDEADYVKMTTDFDTAKSAFGAAVANAFYYASYAKPKIAYETVKSKITEAMGKVKDYQRHDWFVYAGDKFIGSASVRTPDYNIEEIFGKGYATPIWEVSATVTKEFQSTGIVSGILKPFMKFVSEQFPTHTLLIRVSPTHEVTKHLVTKNHLQSMGTFKYPTNLVLITLTFEYEIYVATMKTLSPDY